MNTKVMITPSVIYLIDTGDEISWCDDPNPSGDIEPDDAVMYVKSSINSAATDLLEALEDMLNQGCGEYQKKSCGHNFYCVCPGDKARLAIAKARGQ